MKWKIPDTIPRAALITGGGTPVGQAIAHALAGAGFAVGLQFGLGAKLDAPAGMTVFVADLDDEAQTEALPGRASEALGPLGVLVNAAFVGRHDTSRTQWDEMLAINARAPFVLIRQFAKLLPVLHEGVVINLPHDRIRQHFVGLSASQAALSAVTRSMALALAPRVRVNAIGAQPGGGGLSAADVAQASLAILALPSMTGQMLIPNGVPR